MTPEPPLPPSVFQSDPDGTPTESALEAEAAWNDAILIWGRAGWRQVGRICRWAQEVGGPIEGLDCPPPPAD